MLWKTLQLRSQKYLREVNVSVPTLTFPSCCFIGIHFITERDKNINKKKTNIRSCLHPHGKCFNCHSWRDDELVLKFATTLFLRPEKKNTQKQAHRIHMEDHGLFVLLQQLKPCWYSLSFLGDWDTPGSQLQLDVFLSFALCVVGNDFMNRLYQYCVQWSSLGICLSGESKDYSIWHVLICGTCLFPNISNSLCKSQGRTGMSLAGFLPEVLVFGRL